MNNEHLFAVLNYFPILKSSLLQLLIDNFILTLFNNELLPQQAVSPASQLPEPFPTLQECQAAHGAGEVP